MTTAREIPRAVRRLLDHNIELIEWGDQVLESFGYPSVTSVFAFAVNDSTIGLACHILLEAGFCCVEPSLSLRCLGVFGTAGHLFVSSDDKTRSPTLLQILPQSLVHLQTKDTELSEFWVNLDLKVHRPKLAELCIALVRCLKDYQIGSLDRLEPERHLATLIAAGIYKERSFGKIWVPEEELESESDFQARKSIAIEEIAGWTLRKDIEQYRKDLIDIVVNPNHPLSDIVLR
ncbi:hypothetical protein EJ05DRAFT_507158 [Pseudovirgaria hyperparasitica]|uniref:Uncharacterized protein n=1 Tax=Pseudovirgaria hyperparasitica TaxID=470096 RepID=A0A6A6WJH8_9PEZI|nr:uncharacterized protein EJ05DRAFT_507158 [Pseudovirgaria hyperparasitica]KAF2761491.1 hypothetical protein EJ05DRAFT_507158 [Pseudovirgaria hyperparasitica]